jgi:hypothetical protein
VFTARCELNISFCLIEGLEHCDAFTFTKVPACFKVKRLIEHDRTLSRHNYSHTKE